MAEKLIEDMARAIRCEDEKQTQVFGEEMYRDFARAALAVAFPVIRERCAAVDAVSAERARQKQVEGWTPEHDDEHKHGEMAVAAACYALSSVGATGEARSLWPWSAQWWKPKDRRRDLVRAAALIVAEIERLDRRALSLDAPPAGGEENTHD